MEADASLRPAVSSGACDAVHSPRLSGLARGSVANEPWDDQTRNPWLVATRVLLWVPFEPYLTTRCVRIQGRLVQVCNGIELEAVGFRFEPYRWCDLGFVPNSRGNKAAANIRPTCGVLGVTRLTRIVTCENFYPTSRFGI